MQYPGEGSLDGWYARKFPVRGSLAESLSHVELSHDGVCTCGQRTQNPRCNKCIIGLAEALRARPTTFSTH